MKAKKIIYCCLGLFLLLSMALGSYHAGNKKEEPVRLIQEKSAPVKNMPVVKSGPVEKSKAARKAAPKAVKKEKAVEYSWQKTVRGNMEEWTYRAK